MQQIYNIFYFTAVTIILLLTSCSKEERIIPSNTMTKIVSDLYLADQYIENIPEYRAQMDSLYLYEAVIAKYGYTYAEFNDAIKYYLQDGDALKRIYYKAQLMLEKRSDELNRLITKQDKYSKVFWAVDSAKKREINNLWKEPQLRSVLWITSYNKIEQPAFWSFSDTTIFDTPQNSIWWNNNIMLESSNIIDSLYPVLTKDYTLALERDSKNRKVKKGQVKELKSLDSKSKLISPRKSRDKRISPNI